MRSNVTQLSCFTGPDQWPIPSKGNTGEQAHQARNVQENDTLCYFGRTTRSSLPLGSRMFSRRCLRVYGQLKAPRWSPGIIGGTHRTTART